MTRIYSSTIVVRINTGAPTWWLPKVSISRPTIAFTEIKFGWLRACFQIGFGAKNSAPAGEGADQ